MNHCGTAEAGGGNPMTLCTGCLLHGGLILAAQPEEQIYRLGFFFLKNAFFKSKETI